jgi:hypothetical protein
VVDLQQLVGRAVDFDERDGHAVARAVRLDDPPFAIVSASSGASPVCRRQLNRRPS